MTRPYDDLIARVASEEGVPVPVALALVDTENNARDPFDTADQGLWGGGSYGLVMITLPTAREYGYRGDAQGLRDPETNIRYGLRYLLAMFNHFGDWPTAYAAYNAGPDLSPYPQANVDRFSRNLERETADFQEAPATMTAGAVGAGAGGLLLLFVLAGWILPAFFKRGRV